MRSLLVWIWCVLLACAVCWRHTSPYARHVTLSTLFPRPSASDSGTTPASPARGARSSLNAIDPSHAVCPRDLTAPPMPPRSCLPHTKMRRTPNPCIALNPFNPRDLPGPAVDLTWVYPLRPEMQRSRKAFHALNAPKLFNILGR